MYACRGTQMGAKVKRLESVKRVIVLWLSVAGVLLQAAVYIYLWFEYYYPIINNFNRG